MGWIKQKLCQMHREGDTTHTMKCEIQLGKRWRDLKPYTFTKDNLQLQYKVCYIFPEKYFYCHAGGQLPACSRRNLSTWTSGYKMLSMIEILHQLIAYYGFIHPRGLKVAKSQVLQRDEEKGHFQAKTSTTMRRWKKSFCLMGRLISFDILILEVEGFWYQKMRLWEGVGCCQHV